MHIVRHVCSSNNIFDVRYFRKHTIRYLSLLHYVSSWRLKTAPEEANRNVHEKSERSTTDVNRIEAEGTRNTSKSS